MRINEQIRERRKKAGLTQAQIANYLGVSPPAVNKWENGVSHSERYNIRQSEPALIHYLLL